MQNIECGACICSLAVGNWWVHTNYIHISLTRYCNEFFVIFSADFSFRATICYSLGSEDLTALVRESPILCDIMRCGPFKVRALLGTCFILEDSKGFWRWCITHRITGFLDFFLHPVFSLTHGAEPFLTSYQLCNYSNTSQNFMEHEGSLLCSQEPSTGPPEPDQCNPYHLILSL
jgi:hypothetical protein